MMNNGSLVPTCSAQRARSSASARLIVIDVRSPVTSSPRSGRYGQDPLSGGTGFALQRTPSLLASTSTASWTSSDRSTPFSAMHARSMSEFSSGSIRIVLRTKLFPYLPCATPCLQALHAKPPTASAELRIYIYDEGATGGHCRVHDPQPEVLALPHGEAAERPRAVRSPDGVAGHRHSPVLAHP